MLENWHLSHPCPGTLLLIWEWKNSLEDQLTGDALFFSCSCDKLKLCTLSFRIVIWFHFSLEGIFVLLFCWCDFIFNSWAMFLICVGMPLYYCKLWLTYLEHFIICSNSSYIAQIVVAQGDDLVYGICEAIDEEKDPRCLMLNFCLVEILGRLYPDPSGPMASFAEDIFDILSRYYPIYFTHVSLNKIELDQCLWNVNGTLTSPSSWVCNSILLYFLVGFVTCPSRILWFEYNMETPPLKLIIIFPCTPSLIFWRRILRSVRFSIVH